MSLLSEEGTSSIISPPSLVYPSLTPKRSSQLPPTDDFQTCINFASRLIKLRSELRSPSYMRSSSFVTQQDYFQQQPPSRSPPASQPSNSPKQEQLVSPPLSAVGSIHSLPNILHYPYSNEIDCREDESEISVSTTEEDEAPQLTYLTELVRRHGRNRSLGYSKHFDHAKTNHLLLPPLLAGDKKKEQQKQKKILSLTNRTLSLSDMIHQVVDEAMNNNGGGGGVGGDSSNKKYSSLALASQQQKKGEGKKGLEEESSDCVIINYDKKEKDYLSTKEELVVNRTPIIDQERNTSRLTITSIKQKQNCICNNNETQQLNPKPSVSCETTTNKSSCAASATSSDTSILLPSTAFLVSISPCSVAAASIARSKRTNIKQQHMVRLSSDSNVNTMNRLAARRMIRSFSLSNDSNAL